jgi:hypothetical protein
VQILKSLHTLFSPSLLPFSLNFPIESCDFLSFIFRLCHFRLSWQMKMLESPWKEIYRVYKIFLILIKVLHTEGAGKVVFSAQAAREGSSFLEPRLEVLSSALGEGIGEGEGGGHDGWVDG